MKTTSIRHQLFLPPETSAALVALAAAPGATKSSILADALTAWLGRRAAHELDGRFGQRLDRISQQLGRIERDGQIMLESLALFIQYQLTVCPPIAEGDNVARALGRDRFNAFVAQIGRQMASGKRTLARAAESEGAAP